MAWVLNDPPPNYALELAKCWPYQVPWSTAAGPSSSRVRAANVSTNYIEFIIPIPTLLRGVPTLEYDGSLAVCTVENQVVSGFTFYSNVVAPGWVEIVAQKQNHGLKDAQLRYSYGANQHPLMFNANL